jgi:hypothetical protein
VRENTADNTRGQPLLLSFFLAALDVDVHIVRVSPLLFKCSTLLPEAAFIEAFTVGQVFGEIRVHIAADFFDLDDGALHRILVGKGKLLHLAQEGKLSASTGAGDASPAPMRFFSYMDPEENTREQIKKVRSHPWIAKDVPVRGFIFDVDTGRLREVKVLEHERAA